MKPSLLGISLGTLCIQSFGAVTITVTDFTQDKLALTVRGGPENALEGPVPGASLDILDFAPGPGTFWINSANFAAFPADLGTLPVTNFGTAINTISIYDDAAGDTVYITTSSPLQIGEYFLQDFSLEWTGTSLFDTLGAGSDPLTTYWGTNATFDAASGTVQSTSALPEPGTYAILLGIGALGLVGFRRSRRRSH